MARGTRRLGWLMGLLLACAGCLHTPASTAQVQGRSLTPVPTQRVPAEPVAPEPAPVRVASAAQAPLPQEPKPPDLPPPPRPQDASLPPPDTTPPPPSPPASPSLDPASADSATNLRRLLKQAEGECATLDSYICRMTRREMVNGSAKPEELMMFTFRKQPFSIYFKWIGKENNGRQVVYVKGKYDDKLHIQTSPGGTSMGLAPDSFLIRRSSRHPVTEAGVCAIVEKYAAALAAADKGKGALRYLGVVKRPDFDEGVSLEGTEQEMPPGTDPYLPRGGRCQLYFNTATHLPVLVITKDERGQEVEYYRFDRFQARVKLDDDDFNPERLFGKGKH